MNIHEPRPLLRLYRPLLLTLVVLLAVLLPAGCKRTAPAPGLLCSLLELRSNPVSHYYDAVVRLERVALKDPLKDNFQVMTPTSAFNLGTLKFTVEGGDSTRLEPGDVFIVPRKGPTGSSRSWGATWNTAPGFPRPSPARGQVAPDQDRGHGRGPERRGPH